MVNKLGLVEARIPPPPLEDSAGFLLVAVVSCVFSDVMKCQVTLGLFF